MKLLTMLVQIGLASASAGVLARLAADVRLAWRARKKRVQLMNEWMWRP